MDDNQPNNNEQTGNLSEQYQSILDKYAADLNVNPPQSEPEPEPEPINTVPVNPEPINPEPVNPEPVEEPKLTIPPPEIPTIPEPVYTPPSTPAINDIPVVSTPKSGGFFKFLFFLSLLIFLGVLGANIYTYFFVTPNIDSANQPTLSPKPTETIAPSICELNDNKYEINQTFPAQDGCNTCTCQSDLTITCTSEICPTAGPTKKVTPTLTAKPTSTLPVDLVSFIKEDVASKNNTTVDKVTTGQYKISGNYAQVAVNGDNFSGYILWLVKSNNLWKIINSGQELPYCTVLSQFKFPSEFECQK